jgi:hypothetical protein
MQVMAKNAALPAQLPAPASSAAAMAAAICYTLVCEFCCCGCVLQAVQCSELQRTSCVMALLVNLKLNGPENLSGLQHSSTGMQQCSTAQQRQFVAVGD